MTQMTHKLQTLEITDKNHIYLNGNLYQPDVALQVLGHWYALGMINDVTFYSWTNAISKPI